MPESGVRTGPPDFIGVGTQRSGTTWMQRLLIDHPRIVMPGDERKEQHFFDWFGKTPMTDADIARYHAGFPRGPDRWRATGRPGTCATFGRRG